MLYPLSYEGGLSSLPPVGGPSGLPAICDERSCTDLDCRGGAGSELMISESYVRCVPLPLASDLSPLT